MLARTARISFAAFGIAAGLTAATGLAGAADAPAAAELQSQLERFTDPSVPTADKANLMVGGANRTANIEKMSQGLANYGTIGWGVSDVRANGDTADATVAISSPHGTMPGVPMTWTHTDAGWKLSEGTACTILAMGKAPC